MKHFYLFLLLIVLSCNSSNKKSNASSPPIIPESLLGKDWEGNEILVGRVSLDQMNYYTKEWMQTEYDFYPLNTDLIENIKPLIQGKSIVLYMGTWCEDSRREVPGMIKILNASGFDISTIEIIAVDEDKRTPDGLEKNVDLLNIPTLLFFENGKEINRIVEFPVESLELDILSILSGKEYKNAYAE